MSDPQVEFRRDLESVLSTIKEVLIDKNRKYGDAALNPYGIFSKAPAEEAIRIRIDDKLKRLHNRQDDDNEDAELDTLGYLILLMIAKLRSEKLCNEIGD